MSRVIFWSRAFVFELKYCHDHFKQLDDVLMAGIFMYTVRSYLYADRSVTCLLYLLHKYCVDVWA